jgi:hypothetical protein
MGRSSADRTSMLLPSAVFAALVAAALISVAGLLMGRSQPPPSASNLVDLDGTGLPVVVKNGPSTLFERITVCYPTESMQKSWSPSLRFPHRDQGIIAAIDDATAAGPCASVRLVIAGWPMRGIAMWSACSTSGQETRHGYTLLVRGAVWNLLLMGAACLLAAVLFRWRHRDLQERRAREGRCRRCGYALGVPVADLGVAGATSKGRARGAACPECGGV